jgi:kynureninase
MISLMELWNAMAAGDSSVLEPATLHRVMRERGARLIKGRDDVAADWAIVLAGGTCQVIADLGDMAVVQIGDRQFHHWVRREDGWIAYEVVIEARDASVGLVGAVIERVIVANDQTAELFHLFEKDTERRIGSRVSGTDWLAISEAIGNG